MTNEERLIARGLQKVGFIGTNGERPTRFLELSLRALVVFIRDEGYEIKAQTELCKFCDTGRPVRINSDSCGPCQ